MMTKSINRHYDRVIVGAGIFGLHAARIWAEKGLTVAIIDAEVAPMMRASYVNQARLHYGYHYPRSLTTALSSIMYYDRFREDFADCINAAFTKIYAISHQQSFISTQGFERFCAESRIPCSPVDPTQWFNPNMVDAAYDTLECSFDARQIRAQLLTRLSKYDHLDWFLGRRLIHAAIADDTTYEIQLDDGATLITGGVLNATYAGLNQILRAFDQPPFALEYQLCEIILATVEKSFGNVGITVMDGDYFSLMPFGSTGLYSLTTVDFTPHLTSRDDSPTFPCQAYNHNCNDVALDHCTYCPVRPQSSWRYAHQRATQYLRPQHRVHYHESLYTVKTILQKSDIDDSRPTLVKVHRTTPWLASVLSGKIATIYDLEEIL
jgi:hypothetical protein